MEINGSSVYTNVSNNFKKMKLISDIINELIDTEKSITSPILKTKVLASRIQNQELLDWINNELRGYGGIKGLPKYRVYKCNLTGDYINGDMQYNQQPVPTVGLSQEWENVLQNMHFDQSVSSLEKTKSENKSGELSYTLPAEMTGIVQRNFRKLGNPYLQLINCKKSVSIIVVDEILSIVRNNLLYFMLKIDSEYGNVTDLNELKSKKDEITTIMNKTIINTSGDGNIISTGDHANVSATINISKGNKSELENYLKSIGLSENDSSELLEIIDSEEPDFQKKTFGQKVNAWTHKILGKTIDGSWNIGIGAAGNLIAEGIKLYYGM
ncbi:MAG: hypothetical protein U9R42_09115 [Bacteroidota bacterium]|nr:hypothetical protein [Bacteroidota bacterium]